MKKFVILGLVLALLLAGCTQQQSYQGGTQQNGTSTYSGGTSSTGGTTSTGGTAMAAQQNGRTVFTMADKAADMGSVTSVMVTVSSVQAHGENNGWVTVSSTPMTFDLLKLKASGEQALLADANLTNDTYDTVRLEVSQVMVNDSSGTHTAKLPSGDLHIAGNFDVSGNSTSLVEFDFITDQSLHVTGNGEYILAPVIHLQTQDNATVDDSDQTNVKVSGGTVRTDVQVGMDENGTIGVGVSIPADADIEVDNNGIIHVMNGMMNGNNSMNSSVNSNGRVVVGVKDKAVNLSSVTGVNVTVNSVMAHSVTTNGWVTLSSATETFDLLQLNASGEEALLADANLSNGSYDQVSLEISNVVVTDSSGSHNAKLPSGDLKIMGGFDVGNNSTSIVTFDFIAGQSLHSTGNGGYILAPVIHLQSWDNASVNDSDVNNVKVMSGNLKSDIQVGMDENGNVGVGLGIPENADVSIDQNGSITVGNGLGNTNSSSNASVIERMG